MKILAPTDFSKNAKKALDYAARFADKSGASLTLFHVYHLPYIHGEMPLQMYNESVSEMEDGAKEKLENFKKEFLMSSDVGTIEVDYETKLGFAVEEIIQYADENDYDLIVMGTLGASDFLGKVLGSITAKVMEKASCPVLAVPHHFEWKQIEKILYATTYSDADIQPLQFLAKVAEVSNANLHVLHINDEENHMGLNKRDAFKQQLKADISYDKLSFDIYFDLEVAEALQSFTEKNKIDLMGVLRKKRGIFESIFHSSISKKMAYHSKVPVIRFQEK